MTTTDGTRVDPITSQVIRSGLVAAAEEMRIALVKTAYNPLIYEVQDFAVALLNDKGEMLAQGSTLPLFLPCLSLTVQNGVRKFGADGFAPGDVLIANDPYSTGPPTYPTPPSTRRSSSTANSRRFPRTRPTGPTSEGRRPVAGVRIQTTSSRRG